MGLKGFRLWDMGQLEFNLQSLTVRKPIPAAAAAA
jgi:hypothetical protein